MDIFDHFATDEALEVEGRWVEFDDKTSFKIARANNKAFARLFTREYNRNKVALTAKGEAAEKLATQLMIDTMAKAILVDWKGPVKLKGEDLSTYSEDSAKRALAHKEFRNWVQAQADDFEAYKAKQDEDEAKN